MKEFSIGVPENVSSRGLLKILSPYFVSLLVSVGTTGYESTSIKSQLILSEYCLFLFEYSAVA
jgi:hypothetical protein